MTQTVQTDDDYRERLGAAVIAFSRFIRDLCPEARLDTSFFHYDTEDALIDIIPPVTLTEEQREALAAKVAEKGMDILLNEGFLIAAGVEDPELTDLRKPQMQLHWMKGQNSTWYTLDSIDLAHEHFNTMHGVYIIWVGGKEPQVVVYVGQGNIKERLTEHRKNPEIFLYGDVLDTDLYVTWATVARQNCDAVEAYLADKWDPKVGERHPQAPHIAVNSPWE